MDQVKVILKQLQKHHFWLLCLVAILCGLVGSTMAARTLSAAYQKEKGTIVAKFQSLDGLRSADKHPNGRWKEGIEKLNEVEKTKVQKAWELVYGEQKSLLVWPKGLGEDFLKFVNERPRDAEIPAAFCSRYQNYIKAEFPRLLKIVDAAPTDAGKNAPAPPEKGKEPAPVHEYKVTWDSSNQTNIQKAFDWSTRPKSLEVRQAQEDLWAYTAILQMIKNVNGDHYVARIKNIGLIALGKPAADAFQEGAKSPHIVALEPASGAPASVASPPPPVGGETVEKAADEGRYVDAEGKPLPGGATAADEFKRLPVFMKLTIDQREIPTLLVECANSPLPVEVRQLRINPLKGGNSNTGSAAARSAGTKGGSESDSNDVPIEIHGIIYIYNPPDLAKLGIQQAAAPAPGAAAGGN